MSVARRAALLGLLALAGCAITAEIAEFPGAAAQIRRFYALNALEENASCTMPEIAAIIDSRTVSSTADRLVLEVRYRFQPFNRIADFGRDACIGWNTRQFTFERSGGGLRLVGMTGEQRLGQRTPLRAILGRAAPVTGTG